MQPAVEARLHVGEEADGEGDGGGEERETDEQPGYAVGGHVQHCDEQAEEEQRRAEVTLENEDRDADEPDDHDGAEVAGAW